MNRSKLLPSSPNLVTPHRRHTLILGVCVAFCLLGMFLGVGRSRPLFAQDGQPTPTPSATPFESPQIQEENTPESRPTPSFAETLRAIATATAQAEQTVTAQATPGLPETGTPTPSPTATPGPDDLFTQELDRVIARMSVADRVGQLFIIDFQGSQPTANSDIAELIQDYRVGGVVISPENGNFSNVNGDDTPVQVAILTNQLQALAYGIYLRPNQALNPPSALLRTPDTLDLGIFQRASQRIPLLVGVEQMGDDLATTSLRQGFTDLPSQMALGATWNPELVRRVGEVVGRELAAVGVNLLLGPSLDVLEQPRPDLGAGLGMQTFGGDPYWVGKLGQAYIGGVHEGSNRQVATMASHFPGQGGTDRRPDEEVATIQKSLQELRYTDLLPFASVTTKSSALLRSDGALDMTEGLISGHIRYSSFQGSRERTPPISLATELGTILALEEFAAWRGQGGLVMSDALGLPAVRRYYDPRLERFQRKQIALDAFLAGNDLLYLSRFSLTDQWEDARTNIKETILFFRDLYTRDPNFASRVDNSLRRILRLKFRLYATAEAEQAQAESEQAEAGQANATVEMPALTSDISLSTLLVRPEQLRVLGGASQDEAQALMAQAAQDALTILYPDPQGLGDTLPQAPQPDDRLLIFTDSRELAECPDCTPMSAIDPQALETIVLRLYGPDATGQLSPDYIVSYTFEELSALLRDVAAPSLATGMNNAIEEADWLIFAMSDVDVARFEYSDAVKQFLRLRSDQLGARVVVLALNAPYYLDSTEIGKLAAYLGIYSKTEPFLESAVRAIFRSLPATGAPPVSAPGTRYGNLLERLEPDPQQRIELGILNKEVVANRTGGGEVSVQADVTIGDVLEIEAGPIVDRNGNPVPDGTNVSFRLIYNDADLALPAEPVATTAGMARIAVPLERPGTLNITATSVDALLSTKISVSIQAGQDLAQINISNPPTDVQPTATQPATPIPESTATAVLESTAPQAPTKRINLVTLAIVTITQIVVLALFLVVLVRVMPRQMLVYRLLWATAMGWTVYILYGIGLIPGSTWLQINLYPWGAAAVVFIGMLIPLVWLQLKTE